MFRRAARPTPEHCSPTPDSSPRPHSPRSTESRPGTCTTAMHGSGVSAVSPPSGIVSLSMTEACCTPATSLHPTASAPIPQADVSLSTASSHLGAIWPEAAAHIYVQVPTLADELPAWRPGSRVCPLVRGQLNARQFGQLCNESVLEVGVERFRRGSLLLAVMPESTAHSCGWLGAHREPRLR